MDETWHYSTTTSTASSLTIANYGLTLSKDVSPHIPNRERELKDLELRHNPSWQKLNRHAYRPVFSWGSNIKC